MSNKRKKIFEIVRQAQQKVVASLENSMNEAKQTADLDESDTISTSALGKQSEASDLQRTLQLQYQSEKTDLEQMDAYENSTFDSVQPGAFVETEKIIFYVGMSLRSLDYEGKEILGISLGSPAFAKIKGFKKGDQFTLGVKDYTIENIY